MAEQAQQPQGQTEDKELGKKCAFTGKPLKRRKRYYRNGQYFVNKTAFKEKIKKDAEEKAAAAAKAAPAEQK